MMKRCQLNFFDGEAASFSDMGDEDFQKAMDKIRYADFNEQQDAPSPADEKAAIPPEVTPVPEVEEGAGAGDVPGAEGVPAAPPQLQPAQTNAPGVPQPLVDKYGPLIGALENDPQFRAAMADAIAARRGGGVPAAAPQAEEQSAPNAVPAAEKEPVCGEDELLEDFEKRHAEWERRQQDDKVRAAVNQALMERQYAQQKEALVYRAREVNSLLQQDAEAPAVGEFFRGNPAPPRLAALMDEDPDTFMYIYDGMRQVLGKGNYFAEALSRRYRGGNQQAGPVAPVADAKAATAVAAQGAGGSGARPAGQAATPQARTVVKAAPAPFTEGASGSRQKGGEVAPDFASMSDKEFALFMEKVKMQGL